MSKTFSLLQYLAVLLAIQLIVHTNLFRSGVHDEIGVRQVTGDILEWYDILVGLKINA